MDYTILNRNVIKAIKEKLPENARISSFLSDTLFLTSEAIYRRLRGEVPFQFYEIYLIAQKMGISLDYLANSATKEVSYFELVLQQIGSEKKAKQTQNKFMQNLRNILKDSYSRFELSYNLFPQVPAHIFYHLSKYYFFKWVYNNNTLPYIPFKKIEYSREIFEMHKKNSIETMKIKHTSYIWDYTIVEMLVREINYFVRINLLDREDVEILKEELYKFLYYVENLTIKGAFPTGNKVNIYISPVNSDAAYSYMESSRFRICIIGVFDFHYIISTDSLAFGIMKEKILSLKKGAALISRSNEVYRVSFFDKQRELVNTL